VTISGEIHDMTSVADRNDKETKLIQASNAMREDAILTWTPEGGEEQFIKVRRAAAPRISGNWVKEFQIALVAEDPAIYSAAQFTKEANMGTAAAGTAIMTEPGALAMSNDFKQVYIINKAAASAVMWVMDRDVSTGALTKKESIAIENSSKHIVITNDGKNVYVSGNGKVSWWKRETNGKLVTKETISAGSGADKMVVGVNGTLLIVCNKTANTLSIFTRNTTSGVLTLATTVTEHVPTQPSGVDFGTNYYGINWMAVCGEESNTVAGWEVSGVGAVTYKATTGSLSSYITAPKSIHIRVSGYGFAATVLGEAGTVEAVFNGNTYKIKTWLTISGAKFSTYDSAEYNTFGEGSPTAFSAVDEAHPLGYTFDLPSGRILSEFNTETTPSAICMPQKKFKLSETYSAYLTCTTPKTVEQLDKGLTTHFPAIECKNDGTMETNPVITITAPYGASCENPVIYTSDGNMAFEVLIPSGSVLTIDTGERYIDIDGEAAFGTLNLAQTQWFDFDPGVTKVKFAYHKITGEPIVKVAWRNAWRKSS
jgi:6-phosphogluconolactonase (cycloisomerase 2 family)